MSGGSRYSRDGPRAIRPLRAFLHSLQRRPSPPPPLRVKLGIIRPIVPFAREEAEQPPRHAPIELFNVLPARLPQNQPAHAREGPQIVPPLRALRKMPQGLASGTLRRSLRRHFVRQLEPIGLFQSTFYCVDGLPPFAPRYAAALINPFIEPADQLPRLLGPSQIGHPVRAQQKPMRKFRRDQGQVAADGNRARISPATSSPSWARGCARSDPEAPRAPLECRALSHRARNARHRPGSPKARIFGSWDRPAHGYRNFQARPGWRQAPPDTAL